MSAVLVRTSMTRLETILKAATSTIMVSTRNITLVWAWMAEKKPTLACSQSNTQPWMPMTCEICRRVAATEASSPTNTSTPVTLVPRSSMRCASASGA